MPIRFKEGNQLYNVREEHMADFVKDYPDAYAILKDTSGKEWKVRASKYFKFQTDQMHLDPANPFPTSTIEDRPYKDEEQQTTPEASPALGGEIKTAGTEFISPYMAELKTRKELTGNYFPQAQTPTPTQGGSQSPMLNLGYTPNDAIAEAGERAHDKIRAEKYQEIMSPYVSTYEKEEKRQALNKQYEDGTLGGSSAAGRTNTYKQLQQLNEEAKPWVEADNKEWTPESADEFRQQVIAETHRDPYAIVPESFKTQVAKQFGKEQSEEEYLAEWLNQKSAGRKAFLHGELVKSLLEPSKEDAERLAGIKERAEANSVGFMDRIKANYNAFGRLGNKVGTIPVSMSILQEGLDINKQTARALDKAEEIKQAYVNHSNDENFFVGVGKGIKDGLSDVDNWTGVYMVGDMGILTNLVGKINRGEKLTQEEEDYMDAQAYKLAVEAAMADELGWGYKSGNVTGVSIPFMLQMIASPVSSSTGMAVNKTLMGLGKRAVNKFGGTILKNLLAKTPKGITKIQGSTAARNIGKGLSRTAGATTAGAMQTAIFHADRTVADAMDRNLGNQAVVERTNEQYGTSLIPTFGEDMLTSTAKAVISGTSMNATEYLGGLLINPLITRYGKNLTQPLKETLAVFKPESVLRAAKTTGAGKAIQAMENLGNYLKGSSKFVDRLARSAEYDGLVSEYLEEVVDNVVNTAIGDMSVEDLLSPKKNAETILGLSWTAGAFNVMNKTARTTHYISLSRKMKKADLSLQEALKNKPEMLSKYEQFKQQLGQLRSFDEVGQAFSEFIDELAAQGSDATVAELIADATRYTSAYTGKMGHDAVIMTENKSDIASLVADSRENGYSMMDAYARKNIKAQLDKLSSIYGETIEEKIAEAGGEVEFLRSIEGQVSDETFGTVLDYILLKEQYEGIKDARADELDAKVEVMNKRVDRSTHRESGLLIGAQMTDEQGNIIADPTTNEPKIFFVVSGDLTVDGGAVTPGVGTTIVRDLSGKYQMVDMSRLSGFMAEDANARKIYEAAVIASQERERVEAEEDLEEPSVAPTSASPSTPASPVVPGTPTATEGASAVPALEVVTEELARFGEVGQEAMQLVDGLIERGESEEVINSQIETNFGSIAPRVKAYYMAKASALAEAVVEEAVAEGEEQAQEEEVQAQQEAYIVRTKDNDLDTKTMIAKGVPADRMASAFVNEFGEEDALATAQAYLAMAQEERSKSKDPAVKGGSLKRKEQYWADVVGILVNGYDFGKTAYDYAQYLQSKEQQETVAEKTAPAEQKAESVSHEELVEQNKQKLSSYANRDLNALIKKIKSAMPALERKVERTEEGSEERQDAEAELKEWSAVLEAAESLLDEHKKGSWKNQFAVPLSESKELSIEDVKALFESLNGDKAVGELFEKVYAVAKTLGLKIKISDQLSTAQGNAGNDGIVKYAASLFYLPHSDQERANTLLHELIHTCTMYATGLHGKRNNGGVLTSLYERLPQEIKDACAELEEIYNNIKNDKRVAGEYGITSVNEMVAELSNPVFREKMKEISLWGKIVGAIKRLFGFEALAPEGSEVSNALAEAERVLEKMLDNFDKSTYDAIKDKLQRSGRGRRNVVLGERLNAFARSAEEFEATQREAVEKVGIVMPRLAIEEVNIVDIPRHPFTGTLKEARSQARQWAKENFSGKKFSLKDKGGEYVIGSKAIKKYLEEKAMRGSDNAMVHLSTLLELPRVIEESITGEIHADYGKGEDGKRRVENGIDDPGLLIHRMYGAIRIGEKVYRVKTTMREYIEKKSPNNPHSYEVTEIELLEDSPTDASSGHLNRSYNSISGAKLLKNVTKSYEENKFLLEESQKLDEISPETLERKGDGRYTDEELALINDPAARLYGESFRTKKQQKAYAERVRNHMRKKANELAEKLHLPVEIIESEEDMAKLQGKKAKAKGWYEVKSGKIVLVLPNNESVADIVETVLHEGVAHLGLRKLFGKQFTQFLDNVYNHAEQSIREKIDEIARKGKVSTRTATEEYLASLAETTDFENTNATWWLQIKKFFLDMLHAIGFNYKGGTISDSELRYILWRSYENLKDPNSHVNMFSQAKDVVMQNRLKAEEFEAKERKRILATGKMGSNLFAADRVNEEENNYEKTEGIKEKTLSLSLTNDNVYEQLELLTRGIEAGNIRVRCLGEEVGRGRDNICLSAGIILSSVYKKGDGNFGRSLSKNAPRHESKRAIEEAESRARSLVTPLIEWAKQNGFFFTTEDILKETGKDTYDFRGVESEVFIAPEKGHVVKVTSPDLCVGSYLLHSLVEIALHNRFFPETRIEVIGYGVDKKGRPTIYSKQPFVEGLSFTETIAKDPKNPTGEEFQRINKAVDSRMLSEYGITVDEEGTGHKDGYLFEDINGTNVILTPEGKALVIDSNISPERGITPEDIEIVESETRVEEETLFAADNVEEEETLYRMGDANDPNETAQRVYNEEMLSARFLAREAMVDYLAALDFLQRIIAEKGGKITSFQDAYSRMLALSSRNKQEIDLFDYSVMPQLTKAIGEILGRTGKINWESPEAKTLQRYAKVKHGIERDRDMAVRKALPAIADMKFKEQFAEINQRIEESTLRSEYEALIKERADMRANPAKYGLLSAEQIEGSLEAEWYKRTGEIRAGEGAWKEKQQKMDKAIAEVFGLDQAGLNAFGLELTEDYSGITETLVNEGLLTRKEVRKDRYAARKKAYEFVEQYEEQIGQDKAGGLWNAIKAVSGFALEKQRQCGLVSAKYVADCNKRFEFYVPLRGFNDEVAHDVYDYLDDVYNNNNPVQTAEGRESEAGNPFANLMNIGYRSITAGNHNLAVQAFWNLANRKDVKGFLVPSRVWHLAELTPEQQDFVSELLRGVAVINNDEILPYLPEDATAEEIQGILDAFEEFTKKLKARGYIYQGSRKAKQELRTLSKAEENAHRVKVYMNGEARYVTVVGNPRAAQALNGKLNPEQADWAALKGLQNFLAGAFTSQNPSFALANLVRDTQHANMRAFITENPKYWRTLSKKQLKFWKYGVGNIMKMLAAYENSIGNTGRHEWGGTLDPKNEMHMRFKRFMEQGGATGFTFSRKQHENLEKLAKMAENVEGKSTPGQGFVVGEFFDAIRTFTEASELVNRFAAYETSLEMGRTEQQAIRDAKEITLNFNRKGAGRATYNASRASGNKAYTNVKYSAVNGLANLSQFGRDNLIFWNASVQGAYQLWSMLKKHPIKTLIAYGAVPYTLAAFGLPWLNALLCGGDDDKYYDELPEYERQRNICIKIPGTKGWFKIPLDPATQKIWAMGEATGAWMHGKKDVSSLLSDIGTNFVGLFSPVDIYWGDKNQNIVQRALSVGSSFTPTLAQPLLHTFANRDWKGKPLENDSRYLDHLPSYKKAFKSDKASLTELSKWINTWANGDADTYKVGPFDFASPGVMEELLFGYTGGYGQAALAAVETAWSLVSDEAKGKFQLDKQPIINRFWVEGDPGQTKRSIFMNYNREVGDFMEEVEQRRSAINSDIKNAAIKQDDTDYGKAVDAREKFLNSTDWKKYAKLKATDAQVRQEAKGGIENASDISISAMLEAIEMIHDDKAFEVDEQ